MEEYKRLLKNVLREDNTHKPGLFFGDIGVCSSLYLMNKYLNDGEIEQLADELLDKVIADIVTMKDVSFDNGLSGIGWAINILHINGCIKGNIDDILFNIDAILYKSLNDPNRFFQCDLMKGLIGLLVYYVYRFKNSKENKDEIQYSVNEAALQMVIDKLEDSVPAKFSYMSQDLYPTILWEYPILFFCLGEVMRLGIYREKIEGMLNSWSHLFTNALPYLNINRLTLADSLAYMNRELKNKKVEEYIDTLFYSINFNEYLCEIDRASVVLNGDWFCALFSAHKALKLMDHRHVRYSALYMACPRLYKHYCDCTVEKLKSFPQKQRNGTLINGISGAMLAYCFLQILYKPSEMIGYIKL